MEYEFDKEEVFTQKLELADPGNSYLRGTTSDLTDYYLLIRTSFGKTSILKFGPLVPDLEMLIPGFNVSYKKFDFNQAKINKEINLFLNDEKHKITEILELTQEEAFNAFPNITELFNLS